MSLDRVTHVNGPLVKGKFYLVPTILARWLGQAPRPWPVIGTLHTDPKFFEFHEPHYHVDVRFVSQKWHTAAARTPITRRYSQIYVPGPNSPLLPGPVFKRRKCIHPRVLYRILDSNNEPFVPDQIRALRTAFAGQQCERGHGGWICPHRKASVGSISPIDGIITCPLHGLRIDAATGKVLAEGNEKP